VWEIYRRQLSDSDRALRTLDRYDYVAAKITAGLGGVRIREATTQRLDGFIRTLAERNGPSVARTAKVLLSGIFKLAVRYGATTNNPVRDVSAVSMATKASRALTVDDLQAILRGMATSTGPLPALAAGVRQESRLSIRDYCAEADLADVVVMFAATGCRISEVLGLRWSDVDLDAKTIAVTGKVIRAKGRGLIREGTTKSEAGKRVLPLPAFAVSMPFARQVAAAANPHDVVFPSQVGTLRDPDNCSKQWRRVRDALGYRWVTTHTFRRTLATIIDAEGMSARIGADHLGHRHVSMTQDVYMGRGSQRGCGRA
jgi:integrase